MNGIFPRFTSALFALFLIASVSIWADAQGDDATKLRTDAFRLIDEQKFTEALPLLERLAVLTPNDPRVQRNLAFALLGQSKNTADANEARQLRARARIAFVKARAAGDDSPLVSGMIDSIPADGGTEAAFGPNLKADEIMQEAEAAFSSGNLDKALELYQKALKIDPKLYYAALFSGDVYTHKKMYADAEVWYQKAISIDPNIETAYRYSATPLMKQQKYTEARDRYIEAWITEPYSKFAIQGMVQWGQITGTRLAHPQIDAPKTTVGADGKEKTTINVNPLENDGSMAWIAYSATREIWKKEKFAKTYPTEKTYRHSLAEETDALRSVVTMAKTLKVKKLNAQIAMLEKLDKDGVLEAYVLMATPDNGIARDHAQYLGSNRAKMREYVMKYVISGKQ
ncbi:MAG TPA: tetratricopeptide repeat protein [Pyrinomonadaceae bacterium]